MRIIILGLTFVFLSMTSCSNYQGSTNEQISQEQKVEIEKLNDLLKNYEVPSQKFSISSKEPSQIKGKLGTIININPEDLITISGQPLANTIEIELKELSNQEQLLRSNAQTVSDGHLLVSGGAYYIMLKSNGEDLKLKDGRSLTVGFPRISEESMTLFYGEKGSLGQLNWKEAKQDFESEQEVPSQPAPAPQQEGYTNHYHSMQSFPIYKAIKLNNLGWINCDRFYDIENKTDLMFAFNPVDSISSASVFLVFKDINSIMEEYYWHKESDHSFRNIPTDKEATLIAVSIKGTKIYAYKTAIKIKTNKTIELALQEISKEKLDDLFHAY